MLDRRLMLRQERHQVRRHHLHLGAGRAAAKGDRPPSAAADSRANTAWPAATASGSPTTVATASSEAELTSAAASRCLAARQRRPMASAAFS
jgi:hypothetical protein